MSDHRFVGGDRARHYENFDEKSMLLKATIYTENDDEELVEFPALYEVCQTCDGKGSHVSPSIDSHGITASEWAEWDFEDRERYVSGEYDVPCYECGGKRVVPEVDESRCSKDLKVKLDKWRKQLAEQAQCDADYRRAVEMGY